MLLFCPSCSNVLTVSTSRHSDPSETDATNISNRLECRTCPYQYILTKRYYERKPFERKIKEDVLQSNKGEGSMTATKQCDKSNCEGREASFHQVQIRSADEPMTTFFTCLTCGTKWREN